MNDTEKLNLLADWFDAEQDNGRWDNNREVQEDLRDLARRILAIGGNVPQQGNAPDAKPFCPFCHARENPGCFDVDDYYRD